MNSFSHAFIFLACGAVLFLPRRWAALPFLMAACYITLGQVEKIGPFHFNVIRMIVPFGVARVLFRGEKPAGGLNGMDRLLIIWALWALCASFFHRDPTATLINNLGRSYDTLGIYFLLRCFCQTEEAAKGLIRLTAILLVPVALEMLNEHITKHNLFSVFGGVQEVPATREGHIRAQGPFRHPILAGTVGATTFPLMVAIWKTSPIAAKIGTIACVTMVLTSFSSAPWMSFFWATVALLFWRWRHLTKEIRIAAVVCYLLLELVMKAPAYYLIARIDLSGGSTGWHRARLIESAIEHIHEWWFAGTDYTRHWMPTGVSWSPDHTDITNHYIKMGILGGMPLMVLFVLTLWLGFRYVGQALKSQDCNQGSSFSFFLWCLGSALFAHAVTFVGVSYFDQAFVFLYLTLALISSTRSMSLVGRPTTALV